MFVRALSRPLVRARAASTTPSVGTMPLLLIPAGVTLKDPTKTKKVLGEDAFFTTPHAVGVADGVGGWSEEGVDSGIYARGLLASVEAYCVAARAAGYTPNAAAALHHAHKSTRIRGSSTACVAVARPDGKLDIINVGDSGAQLWRRTTPLSRSPLAVEEAAKLWTLHSSIATQQYDFNAPFQVGVVEARGQGVTGAPVVPQLSPAPPPAQLSPFPNESHRVSQGANELFRPRSGDLVILSTDGVLDNLGPDDIAAILGRFAFEPCMQLARWRRVQYVEAAAAHAAAVAGGGAPRGIAEGGTGIPLVARHLLASAPEVISPSGVAAQERDCRALLAAMASSIAFTAQRVGNDHKAHNTPWAKEVARRYPHLPREGGKLDDATVVVALCACDDFVGDL